MKRSFQIFLFLFFASGFTQAQDYINDKNAEVRSVSGYSAIKISGGIELYLSQGTEAVAVSAEEEGAVGNLKTEVKNGTLEIWYEENKKSKSKRHGKDDLKAYVSFSTLNRLDVSGACEVKVSGSINVGSLKINIEGASEFKGAVRITDLNINMSGASDLDLSGSVTNLKIKAEGASDLDGFELISDECIVEAEGASDIRITASKSISAEASGASNIHYKGNAAVKKSESSGAGTIKKV